MTETTNTTETIRASIAAIRALPEDYTVGQKASLDIEADGTLTLDTQHPDVNGVSMAIWNGLTRSVALPTGIIPARLADWLEDNLAELQTIVDGMDSEWNGSNHIGTLTDEAREQLEAWSIESLPFGWETGDLVAEWEAADWLDAVKDEFRQAESAEAAEALAADYVEQGEVFDAPDGGRMIVDLEAAKRYAREQWEQAQPDEDE